MQTRLRAIEVSDDASGEGLLVLLVHADGRAAEEIAAELRESGHEVLVAADAHSALAVAQNTLPDVALVADLPEIGGEQVVKRLRRLSSWKRPFLLLAGRAHPAGGPPAADLHIGPLVDLGWLRPFLARLQSILKPGGEEPGYRFRSQFLTCQ